MKYTMAELQNSIEQISQKVDLVNYKIGEIGEKVDRTNAVLDGDKDHYIEGVIDKVERHEQTVKTVNVILENAKFFWAIMGVLGVSSVASLIDIIQKVLAK